MEWRVNITNCIEDQWPLVLFHRHVPVKEDKLSKAFKPLAAKAYPKAWLILDGFQEPLILHHIYDLLHGRIDAISNEVE